jgi:hypothetical protein
MIDFAEIRDRLQQDVVLLCRELVPEGRISGKYWIGKNPTRADRHGGSFWVMISGPAIGAWRDEAGVRGVDEGDIVKLVQYCRHLPDMKETRQECLKLLGLADAGGRKISAEEIARRNAVRTAAREKADREEAQRRAKNAKGALAWWLKAQPLTPANFPGSIVDTYLRSRSIDLVAGLLEKGRPLPGALRFFPALDYTTADGEVIEGLPCVAALMSGRDGKARGLHRTWLRPDGSGKADLPEPRDNKPRKIWPAGWEGSVIRISKGGTSYTPEEAVRRGLAPLPLIIVEGWEDGVVAALAQPSSRVWAAGTLGNIGNVPIDHPCVSRATVCQDNDWDKPEAIAAFDKGMAALRRHNKPLAVARSRVGKDINDRLKGERI